MKKTCTLILICFTLSAKADYWTQKADFGGIARSHAFSFAIGNKGYLGSGDGYTDFWEYDPATNVWTQKADFATVLFAAVGFSINNKGYAGTGSYSDVFWEYDPSANIWTQKANFGGVARQYASGFSIGSKGYIGTGISGATFFSDFWEWDQASNVWTQKTGVPVPRAVAVGFSIDTKGYISTGRDASFSNLNDLWEYDPLLNTWTQKANFPGAPRQDDAAFSICGKGYLGIGGEIPYYNDFWQYDPALNQWIQKTSFGGTVRDDAAYFSISTKGYIGLGQYNNSINYSDFWEYTPDSACTTGMEEIPNSNLQFTIAPNPANDFIVVNYAATGKEKINLTIADLSGKKVFSKQVTIADYKQPIDISNLSNGIYFVTLDNGKEKVVKKFLKD